MIAQLIITIDESQSLTVTGPIENMLLAFGMLEIAKDTIRAHNAKKEDRIVKPSPALSIIRNPGN